MDQLRVGQRTEGDWVVLTPVGPIDVGTVPRFDQALTEVQQAGAVRVALELDGVELLDSFGVGVIAGGLKRTASQRGELAIICSRTRLLEVLASTGLDRTIRIGRSLDELRRASGGI